MPILRDVLTIIYTYFDLSEEHIIAAQKYIRIV